MNHNSSIETSMEIQVSYEHEYLYILRCVLIGL